jgi:hypothetical protein
MGLLETTTELAKIAGKLANPELVQEAMKANAEALDLSRENLELQKQVAELERKLVNLQNKADLLARVYRLSGYVFLDGDRDPHCPVCWDKRRELIHIHHTPFKGHHCPVCTTQFPAQWPQNPSRDNPEAVIAF